VYRVEYDDLTELARLCLLRASAARTLEAADALREMAEEYQARAAALKREESPDITGGALCSSIPEAPSGAVQQQQQPGSPSTDSQSSPSRPERR
jgi:hypothetical protein